jgi:hypothetical protein
MNRFVASMLQDYMQRKPNMQTLIMNGVKASDI